MILRFLFKKSLLQSIMAAHDLRLESESRIPWKESFQLCCGIDALTGDSKIAAVRVPTMGNESLYYDSRTSTGATAAVNIIHGVYQQSRMHRFEVGGIINPMGHCLSIHPSLSRRHTSLPSTHIWSKL